MLMKRTNRYILYKFFNLAKSWEIKISLKASFLAQFQTFLDTSTKTVACLTHHPVCHHWPKFQTKLTTF